MTRAAIIVLVVAGAAATARAYPQYQISRETTCTGCHLSPAGGGLLGENGLAVAENSSQWGTAPEFLDGLVSTPKWLVLGGDIRYASGYDHREPTTKGFVTFPMQADVYANAIFDALSVHVTAGARDPDCGDLDLPMRGMPPPSSECKNNYSTVLWSREHWLQWQHPSGLYLRAGRFMPVYGLRFFEHPIYTREYGGTPLYAETYAAAAEYITPDWEVHATAFVHDPLQPTTEIGNGVALYAEDRVQKTTAVGAETKVDITGDDRKIYGGVTAKQALGEAALVSAEAEVVHQKVNAGGTANGVVAHAMGTYFLGAVMIDLGLGFYTPDVHIRYVDQEAADLDLHWFMTSHVELVLINRFQMLEFGAGGLSSGYSLLQLHYRL